MNEETPNTTTAPVEVTTTPAPGAVMGAKGSAAKPAKGNKPADVVVPVVEAAPPAQEPAVEKVVSLEAIRVITVDSHKRLVQYLGVVNPGVIRILLEMLIEQEGKIIKLFNDSNVTIA